MDLLAYWQIQKTPNCNRWMLSGGASLRDLYDMLLTSHGKAPPKLFQQPSKPLDSTTRRQWEKSTGSNPSAIEWAMKED